MRSPNSRGFDRASPYRGGQMTDFGGVSSANPFQLPAPRFIFMTTQVGAERALKAEMSRRFSEFRFAFSQPGFITYKVPPGRRYPEDFDPGLVFARSVGFSLGKIEGTAPEELAKRGADFVSLGSFDRLHVWQRDAHPPGYRGYEPGPTPEAALAEELLRNSLRARLGDGDFAQARPTRIGDLVLNCILLNERTWWFGYHRAKTVTSCWPGGLWKSPRVLDEGVISRAYFKLEEAVAWAALPLREGDPCLELGCAPGGAAQYLLDRGLHVVGVDPALVDERIASHGQFRHLRMRAHEVPHREVRRARWLFADMNVAPPVALRAMESIAAARNARIRGILLNLKLADWDQAEKIPQWLDRMRSWGFSSVRARQLHHHRQEICVAALRRSPVGTARNSRSQRRHLPRSTISPPG